MPIFSLRRIDDSGVSPSLIMLNCGTDVKDFHLVQFKNVTNILLGHKTASGDDDNNNVE